MQLNVLPSAWMPGLPGDEGTEGSVPATAGDTGERKTEMGLVLAQRNGALTSSWVKPQRVKHRSGAAGTFLSRKEQQLSVSILNPYTEAQSCQCIYLQSFSTLTPRFIDIVPRLHDDPRVGPVQVNPVGLHILAAMLMTWYCPAWLGPI